MSFSFFQLLHRDKVKAIRGIIVLVSFSCYKVRPSQFPSDSEVLVSFSCY